jgi:hypothetical protein
MRLPFVLLLALLTSPACSADDGLGDGHIQQSLDSSVVEARIRERSSTARVLELLASDGHVVATYYPGFFNATQLVPDPDSGALSGRRVPGTWFLGAALDAASGRVAVAVRGFVYAETSFDLVYLIDTRSTGFGQDPYADGAFTSLPFDGRKNDGSMPSATTSVRPWLDIVPESVDFDAVGRLHLGVADASGATGEYAYAPDLRVDTCTWHYSESPARCPDPARN